jgi:hypothetical protein
VVALYDGFSYLTLEGWRGKKPMCPMKFPLLRMTFINMDTTKRGDRGERRPKDRVKIG